MLGRTMLSVPTGGKVYFTLAPPGQILGTSSSAAAVKPKRVEGVFTVTRISSWAVVAVKKEWLDALEHLGTDEHKPFLERAPWLIVVFAESYGRQEDGSRMKNYYVTESVGIATGMLITALHHAGLVTLTHTPSPMKFLNDLLGRPENERPFLILVAGYPDEDAMVPDIAKKPIEEISVFIE